jgi:hypothetical protein
VRIETKSHADLPDAGVAGVALIAGVRAHRKFVPSSVSAFGLATFSLKGRREGCHDRCPAHRIAPLPLRERVARSAG